MTALNAPHALLAPPAAAGARPHAMAARHTAASEGPGEAFGARLAEATRQARDAQAQACDADTEKPEAAPTEPDDGTRPEAAGRARTARRGGTSAGPDEEAVGSDELARLLSRAAQGATPAAAEQAAPGHAPERGASETASSRSPANVQPGARPGVRAGREATQGLARLDAADGLDGAASRAARASGVGAGLSARAGHSGTGGASGVPSEDTRNRLGARPDQALGAASMGPAAEAAALLQGQANPAAAATAAAAASTATAASAGSPSATSPQPVSGLMGPALVAGAAGGTDPLASGPTPGDAVPHFTLSPALESPTFAPALGLQLSVLARDGIEQARMQINPQEMGPIGVQLTVTGQQVQVEFVSEHARTRQVLEQSLQQLASALGEAGLTMTGGGVFQQAREGRGGSREGSPEDRMASRLEAAGPLTEGDALRDPASALRPRVQRGLVDLYA
jgi:hypothetical protein